MHRRSVIFLPVLLVSCSKPAKTFEEVLPAQMSGGWTRGAIGKPEEVPPLIAQLAPEESAEATYIGRGSIRVRAFRMKGETSAFELIQKWRQTDGIAAYKGRYFFVALADGADRDAVMSLLAELQKVNSAA